MMDPELEGLTRELEGARERLAELDKANGYLKRRSDELAGQQLRADSTISMLRHEVRQKRQGLMLLSELHLSIGTRAHALDIVEQTIHGISHRLKMDRAMLLTPMNGTLDISSSTMSVEIAATRVPPEYEGFKPIHWVGYDAAEHARFASLSQRFPAECLRAGGHLLASGESPRSEPVEVLRASLSLPFFVCVPVIINGRVVALLIGGRLKEAKPFATPLDNGDVDIFHAIAGFLVDALKDASYRERLEELVNVRTAELAAARDQALAASRAKSAFVANMSHELRTPLNAIIGYTEMLIEEAEDLEADGLIPDMNKVHAAANHLLTLISGILDLSKIEAGKMDLYLEEISVLDLTTEVVNLVRPVVEKNGNTFVVSVGADVGVLRADTTKVRQALVNLLSNAAKFTKQGEVALVVTRISLSGGDRLVFRVRDTGIGMNRQQLGRIFQAFHQAEASIAHKFGGTGLGLAISRVFCRMMKGDITVESELGKGSTFTIELPARVPEPEPDAAPESVGLSPDRLEELTGNRTVTEVGPRRRD